jgi:hypothetical protein
MEEHRAVQGRDITHVYIYIYIVQGRIITYVYIQLLAQGCAG